MDLWLNQRCQHVIPSLKEWHSKYKDHGLVVIGNHFPEFSYEADLDNVKEAVARYGIEYAVAQVLPALNITNDANLELIRQDIARSLTDYDVTDLRKKDHVRADAAAEAKRIKDRMAPFMRAMGVTE